MSQQVAKSVTKEESWANAILACTVLQARDPILGCDSTQSFLYGPNSNLYMTTRKVIALIIWTFVGKVMSLLFNMLSRLIIDT